MRKVQPLYKAGIYLRLSKDDETVGESSSISTQRAILKDFVGAHDISIFDEYVDDGYSGTNYDRPEFKRMIADIENGFINCVITKDLSRLGRNSAKTSDLLDEYFPSHGVRYIAVIEGYDSLNMTNGTQMTAPFMLLMNEMYARDISNKIRSSFHSKMVDGKYIGSFAPYGYKKDTENGDKNHLIIDYNVSRIVQRIFKLAADGSAPKEIADGLNQDGVATPAEYRCQSRPYLNILNYSKRREWTSAMICKMLRNRVYLGMTIQGKTSKVSFKNKHIKINDKDEWIEVPNTHEPLITQEIYDAVRNRCISRRRPPKTGFVNIFSGIARCADCGRSMTTSPTRKKGQQYNLSCGGYKSYGIKECSNHFISYNLLYDVVLRELKQWLRLTNDDMRDIIKGLKSYGNGSRDNGRKDKLIIETEARRKDVSKLLKRVYEDFALGKVSESIYQSLYNDYNDELLSIDKTLSELHVDDKNKTTEAESYERFFTLIREISEIDKLTKPILNKLIDRIDIGQGHYITDSSGRKVKQQDIVIYYKFIGNVK